MKTPVVLLLLIITASLHPLLAQEWPAVSPEDIAAKSYAEFPGARAVILMRKDERDDKAGRETRFYRIKILNDEGKDNANIETDRYYENTKFVDLAARVIRADGRIVPYTGEFADKVSMKYKTLQLHSKTFALPDVEAGSIIEYQYTLTWDPENNFGHTWEIQAGIPTRDAEFSLRYKKEKFFILMWRYHFLPGNVIPKNENGVVSLTMHNVSAMEAEPFTPPDNEVRSRVDFEYRWAFSANTQEPFWNENAKAWSESAEFYMAKPKAAEKFAAAWTNANDTPETKLRSLYQHVQQLRSLTYERSKHWKEEQKEKLKGNRDVEDLLKHGYGYHNELVRALVALARAAGMEATLVRVAERDRAFHHPELLDFSPYSSEVALVTVNGKEVWLDPGIPFCPFGMLSWEDTGTVGLKLDKNKAVWQKTPEPVAGDATERRVGQVELESDGTLKGTLVASFEGRLALYQRLLHRENDDAEKKKSLEEMFKGWLLPGAQIELTKIDDWNAATDKFVVTANVTVPNFSSSAGKRTIIPILPFANGNPFQHQKRVYPVYFPEPYIAKDEVSIRLPEGWEVETVPRARSLPTGFADLFMTVQRDGTTIKVNRQVTMNNYYYPVEQYASLRDFLDRARLAGEEQAVLRAASK